jgi:hypothetical protein
VCNECGGLLAGSYDPSLGVFSKRQFLDQVEPGHVIDLTTGLDNEEEPAELSTEDSQIEAVARSTDVSSESDGPTDTLMAVQRTVSEPKIVIERSINLPQEVEVEPHRSLWPLTVQVLTAVGYLVFVVVVAVAVNRILRAL